MTRLFNPTGFYEIESCHINDGREKVKVGDEYFEKLTKNEQSII